MPAMRNVIITLAMNKGRPLPVAFPQQWIK